MTSTANTTASNHTNTNGSHASDRSNGFADDVPVTKLLASFIASARPSHLTPALRNKVKEVLLDYIGVVVGAFAHADSTNPIISAVLAFQGGRVNDQDSKGRFDRPVACTVLGNGEPIWLPQYAGMLNATLGHSMDFDDTYAPGTLHAGVTAISAALAQAEALSRCNVAPGVEEFMLAVSVGYEVTCRVGRELGYEAYSRGFHNTSTAGIFGAVASIAVLKHLGAGEVEMAFGLAGSKAAGSMQYLENGSWNKRLHPGFAVHDAFMCVALAEAGVIGATRSIEGKSGVLHAYSPNPNKDVRRMIDQLGQEWVWLASSLKPYPACRMTHAFIELAGNAHKRCNGPVTVDDISEIVLTMSPSNFLLVGDSTPNKIHPENVIDGQFSAYFQVANAVLHGSGTGVAAYKKLSDPCIRALCDKISVLQDPSMTEFSARMEIRWVNGKIEQLVQKYPLGEQQHPFTRDKVDDKFLSLTAPVYGPEKAHKIILAVDRLGEDSRSVMSLIEMLR